MRKKKGTACGYSCISGKLTCSSRILERDAAALVASVQPEAKASSRPEPRATALPQPFAKDHPSHATDTSIDVPPDKVSVETGASFMSRIPDSVEINIYVNDKSDSSKAGVDDPRQGVKVAMAAMKAVREKVAAMPDGTLLSNYPADTDGRGQC